MFSKGQNTQTDSALADRLRARLVIAQAKRQEVPQRVFLFSRAETVCPHSNAVSSPACEQSAERRRQRRPSSDVPEQPCLHALAREQQA
jgi:hypothetical protein